MQPLFSHRRKIFCYKNLRTKIAVFGYIFAVFGDNLVTFGDTLVTFGDILATFGYLWLHKVVHGYSVFWDDFLVVNDNFFSLLDTRFCIRFRANYVDLAQFVDTFFFLKPTLGEQNQGFPFRFLIDYKICFGHPIGHLFTYKVFFEIVSKKVLNSCVKCIEMHDFTIEIGIYPDKIKCKFSVYRCIDITVNTTVI